MTWMKIKFEIELVTYYYFYLLQKYIIYTQSLYKMKYCEKWIARICVFFSVDT